MERLYYACHVQMNGSDAFLIWYQNERDGFVRDPVGRLVVASSSERLAEVAAQLGLSLVLEEAANYDFDRLREWCRSPSDEAVDCNAFLNAWNFFDDLAGLHENPHSSYGELSENGLPIYDKLFWGNNLPPVTPPGERFMPTWDADELETIRQVMEAGLALLDAEMRV